MICRALNSCVKNHHFDIVGYLITEENAFLIIKLENKEAIKVAIMHSAEFIVLEFQQEMGTS